MAFKVTSVGLTQTQIQQREVEEKVKVILQAFSYGSAHHHSMLLELWRHEHASFCLKGLTQLGPSYCVLDANRPWLCYWILHSLALLGEQIKEELGTQVVDFLSRCQMAHLATTYAAVSALVTIGGNYALGSINRERTLDFLLQMKDPCGGFRMHNNGEIDVRGCYTAIAVAYMLDLLLPQVIAGVPEYISSPLYLQAWSRKCHNLVQLSNTATCAKVCNNECPMVFALSEPRFLPRDKHSLWYSRPGSRNHRVSDQSWLSIILRPFDAIGDDIGLKFSMLKTHEGGIGAEPGAEAHGGYTYCGLATLVIINQAHYLDIPALLNWAVFRQGSIEGGFQGRVNKLVDGCYSFWQGGIFPLIQRLSDQVLSQKITRRPTDTSTSWINEQTIRAESSSLAVSATSLFPAITEARLKHAIHQVDEDCEPQGPSDCMNFSNDHRHSPLFNTQALQGYILLCCQVLEGGGLRDKPGKSRDYYHTCYCLSGLSTAQFSLSKSLNALPLPSSVLGPFDNLLVATHPLSNVVMDKYYEARRFFTSMQPVRVTAQ